MLKLLRVTAALSSALLSLPVTFLVLSTKRLGDWIRKEIIDNDPYDKETFFPLIGEVGKEDFYGYQHRTVLNGYQMHCTDAMKLWQAWWGSSSRKKRLGIPLDLLFLNEGIWSPVADLICRNGTLYLKTWGKEVALQGSDIVVWLKKANQDRTVPDRVLKDFASPA